MRLHADRTDLSEDELIFQMRQMNAQAPADTRRN